MNIRERQAPLRERYQQEPKSAIQTLQVRSRGADLADPLHCAVGPAQLPEVTWRSGAHASVGGEGDAPCSGDLETARLLGKRVAELAARLG